MAVGKEIRTQIASIKNTGKITSAMEMVAASKMKKAQDRMHASRPYTQQIAQIISRLMNASSEYKHPYMDKRENIKTVGYIVISSDRGLCGGLNNNLFRKLLKEFSTFQSQGKNIELCTIGKKAGSFFNAVGMNIVARTIDLGDTPRFDDLVGSIKIMLDKYDNGEIDELVLAHNTFENTITQTPTVATIIPMQLEEIKELNHHWDYIYEPEADVVIGALVQRYIESSIYQSIVENLACEQSARMVAMKSATDNAADMVDRLSLIYNKARQAAITQEISEIVSGAAAV